MASAFGHAIAALAIGTSFSRRLFSVKFWLLGIFCSIVPDFDVIGFAFDIEYGSFWGHRGFTHSFVFAILLGIAVTTIFYPKKLKSPAGIGLILFFSLCAASHSILDGMTTGGMGIAYFSPFDNGRYFLPWRVIQVSPIGLSRFFSAWGAKVLLSELIWIGVPAGLFALGSLFIWNRKK